MEQLESYELRSLTIRWRDREIPLKFSSAFLFVDKSEFELGWFIDTNDWEDKPLLEALQSAADIKIGLTAITKDGKPVTGTGYIYPNPKAVSASIKGVDELLGYPGLHRI